MPPYVWGAMVIGSLGLRAHQIFTNRKPYNPYLVWPIASIGMPIVVTAATTLSKYLIPNLMTSSNCYKSLPPRLLFTKALMLGCFLSFLICENPLLPDAEIDKKFPKQK